MDNRYDDSSVTQVKFSKLLYCRRRNPEPFTCTPEQYNNIIDKLGYYLGPGYEFGIDPSTEGGIEFLNWPGKTKGYKSIRFKSCDDFYGDLPGPFILNGKKENRKFVELGFKALKYAPSFSENETRAIYDSFKSVLDNLHDGWSFSSYKTFLK